MMTIIYSLNTLQLKVILKMPGLSGLVWGEKAKLKFNCVFQCLTKVQVKIFKVTNLDNVKILII